MSSPNPFPYPSPPSKSHPEEHPPRQSHASLQSSQSTVDPVQAIATDIQTLESLIRDYERKLAYESSVRDSARALLTRAASSSDKRTAQRQLDFAQHNIQVIASQLDTFMQRQQQARDALQRQYLDQAASVAAAGNSAGDANGAPPPRGLASFNNPVMTSASVPVASPPPTPYGQRSFGRSGTPGSPPPRTMASLPRQQPGSPSQRTMASLGRSNTASRSQPNISSSGQQPPLMSPTYPPERGARKGSAPSVLMSNSTRMAGSPSASLERGMGARGRELEALKAQVAELMAKNQALESQKSFALPEPDFGTAFCLDPPTTTDASTARAGTTPLDAYLPMLSNLSFMGLVSQVSGLFAPTAPAVDPRTLDASVTDHVWKLEGAIMDLEYAVAECVKTAAHLAKMQGMRSGDTAKEEAKGVERTVEALMSILFVTSGEKESLRIPLATPKRPRDTTIIDLLREVNAGKPVRRSAFRTSAHPTVQLMPADEAVQKALEYDALQKREQQRVRELASVQQSHERLERELVETSKQVAGLKEAKLQLEMRVSEVQRKEEGQRDRLQELEAEVGKLRPRVVELENSERELTTQLKSQAALLEEQRREMTNALAASIPRPPAKNTSALNQLLQERDTELSSTRAQLAQVQSNVTQLAKFAEQQKGEYELMLQQVHKEMEVVAQQNEDLSNQIVELRQANSVIAGVTQYQERISNLESAVGQLQVVVAEKDALLERARDTVEDYRERITVLATQVEAAKKTGQGSMAGMPALGSALASQPAPQVDVEIKSKLAAAEEQVETLTRQAEAARALASKWEGRVRDLESSAPVTSTANVAPTATGADVQAQVADLESQLAEAKSSIKKKTALINKLKEELERAVDAASPPGTLQRSASAGRVRQSMMPSRKSVAASSAPGEPDLVEMNNTTPPRRRQGSEPNITTPSPNARMRQSSVPSAGRQSIVSNRQSVSGGKDEAVANLADALRKKTLLVTKLQAEVDELRAKLDGGGGSSSSSSSRAMGTTTAAALANLTSSNPGDLAKNLEQTREQLEAAREEITSLNQQVATDAATLAEFGAAVKKKSTLVEKLTAKVQTLEQEKQTLEKQHTDDFAKIQRLAKMVREYKTQSMTRGAEVEELTAKLANNGPVSGVEAELAEAKQAVERVTAELQRERQVVADREAEIARMNKELQRARSAAVSGGQQSSQSSVSMSELATELNKSQARVQDLEREVNELRSQPPPAAPSFVPVAPLVAGGSSSSPGIVFNPSMLGAGLRKNSQPDLSRSISPAVTETDAARSRSRSVPETQLGQQIDNLNRSRDAFGSSVRQLKDALDDVERATLTQSSRAIGDEGLGDDPDVSKLLSENRLLREQLDSVLNQLAATADIEYLRSQLADMPTKQEIEAMRSTIASQADYTYLRAQLAELPTKAEVVAMRSALASMADHEYLIEQLSEAPSKHEVDSMRAVLASQADYEYLRSQLAALPTRQEVDQMRNMVAGMADHEYLIMQLSELPTRQEIDAMRTAAASTADYEYLRGKLAELPTIEEVQQMRNTIAGMSDYEYLRSRLSRFEGLDTEVERLRITVAGMADYDYLRMRLLEFEGVVTGHPLSLIELAPQSEVELVEIRASQRSTDDQAPRSRTRSISVAPRSRSGSVSRGAAMVQPTVILGNVSAEDLEALRARVAATVDYEHKHARLLELEPLASEVEQLRRTVAAQADYEYLRSQLADLPSTAEIESMRTQLALQADYSHLVATLVEVPTKQEVERMHNTIAGMADYEYLRQQLADMPTKGAIEQMCTTIAAQANHEWLHAQHMAFLSSGKAVASTASPAPAADIQPITMADAAASQRQLELATMQLESVSQQLDRSAQQLDMVTRENEDLKAKVYSLSNDLANAMAAVHAPTSPAASQPPSVPTTPPRSRSFSGFLPSGLTAFGNRLRGASTVNADKTRDVVASPPVSSVSRQSVDRLVAASASSISTEPSDVTSLLVKIELLQNQLASMADYSYLRSQLAELPSKSEVDEMRATIAGRADYEYLRSQISLLPTVQEVESMRAQLSSMADYEYLRSLLAELPTKSEVDAMRSALSACSDYEHKHQRLMELEAIVAGQQPMHRAPSADANVDWMPAQLDTKARMGSKSDLAFGGNLPNSRSLDLSRASSLGGLHNSDSTDTITPYTVAQSRAPASGELQTLRNQVKDLQHEVNTLRVELDEAKQREASLSRRESVASLPDSSSSVFIRSNTQLRARVAELEANVDDLQRDLAKARAALQSNAAVPAAFPAAQVSTPTALASSGLEVEAYVGELSKLRVHETATADYEYKHARLLELEPMAVEVESLRRTVASQADYFYLVNQLSQLPTAQQVDQMRMTIASQADYSYLVKQLSDAPTKAEIDLLRTRVAMTCDYEHIAGQLLALHGRVHSDPHGFSNSNNNARMLGSLESTPTAIRIFSEPNDRRIAPSAGDSAIVDALQRQAETKSDAIRDLESKLAEQASVIRDLQQDLAMTRSAASAPTAKDSDAVQALQAEVEAQTQVVRELQSKLSAAQHQLDDMVQTKLQLQEMMHMQAGEAQAAEDQLMRDIQQLQGQNNKFKVDNEQLLQQIEALMAEVDRLQQASDGLRSPRGASIEQVEMLKEVNKNLEERVVQLQAELDTILEKNMQLVMDLAQYQ